MKLIKDSWETSKEIIATLLGSRKSIIPEVILVFAMTVALVITFGLKRKRGEQHV